MGRPVQCPAQFTHVFVLPHVKSSSRTSFSQAYSDFSQEKEILQNKGLLAADIKKGPWLLSRDRVCVVLNRAQHLCLIVSIFAALVVSLEIVTLPCSLVPGEKFSLE